MDQSAPATAQDASRYLMEDNGWTREEFEAFLATMLPWDYPTTTDGWTEAAQAYNTRLEEGEAAASRHVDMVPCHLEGHHLAAQRHTRAECAQEAANEADRESEAAFIRRHGPGVL